MSSEADIQGEYVYYEEHDEIEDEYVYDENPSDNGRSLPSADSSTNSKCREQNDRFDRRPKHMETIEGIYDELDYDLSNPTMTNPTMDSKNETSSNNKSETKEKNNFKTKLKLNKKTIIIVSIFGTCVIGAITIGVVLSIQGTEPKLNTIYNATSNSSTEAIVNNSVSNRLTEIAVKTRTRNIETTLVPFTKNTIGKSSFVLNHDFRIPTG